MFKFKKEKDYQKEIADYNFEEREILIEYITPTTANEIDRQIRFYNLKDEENGYEINQRTPIKIYINTFGGSLLSALTIIDSIKMSKTPVYTINIGTAYKEGFYIFLAGHVRYSYKRASFLLDKNLGRTEDLVQTNNYNEFCEKQKEELKDILFDKTQIEEKDYENKKESWWITSDEAYHYDICNEIINFHNNF